MTAAVIFLSYFFLLSILVYKHASTDYTRALSSCCDRRLFVSKWFRCGSPSLRPRYPSYKNWDLTYYIYLSIMHTYLRALGHVPRLFWLICCVKLSTFKANREKVMFCCTAMLPF
jgi:hypothetical protein